MSPFECFYVLLYSFVTLNFAENKSEAIFIFSSYKLHAMLVLVIEKNLYIWTLTNILDYIVMSTFLCLLSFAYGVYICIVFFVYLKHFHIIYFLLFKLSYACAIIRHVYCSVLLGISIYLFDLLCTSFISIYIFFVF